MGLVRIDDWEPREIESGDKWPPHTFVSVDANALRRHWPNGPDRYSTPLALAWFSQQRPAICTRSHGELPRGFIAAGIATPPEHGKRRIALTLPRSAACERRAPPTLREVAATSLTHQAALSDLATRADAANLQMSVFGSFAWQHVTGLTYVTEHSDLDLLWRPRSARELQSAIELLARWESQFGLRADGEAVFPGGQAVNWREWAQPSATILVKSITGARLLGRAACLAALSTEPHARE
jgi:phosphoribosyl-dephospho-CoA transferase